MKLFHLPLVGFADLLKRPEGGLRLLLVDLRRGAKPTWMRTQSPTLALSLRWPIDETEVDIPADVRDVGFGDMEIRIDDLNDLARYS